MTEQEIPTIAKYNGEAVNQILRCVEDRTYCAVLGPRLSGKTVLLRYVADTLAQSLGWTCIYIDLYEMGASTLQGFFADLTRITAERLHELDANSLPAPQPSLASSAVFRGFLTDSVAHLGRDLVLIIEHLEALPTDLVQALLTSLRAAYMDQQTLDFRLVVVLSGALSLATLTVGESSPFRGIAQRVFVGDLSKADSEALMDELFVTDSVSGSRQARKRLLQAVQGDPYLIRRMCQRCIDLTRERPSRRLRGRDIKRLTREFLQADVWQYAPLREAIRLIEEDPDLLRCILLLLAHGTVPRTELPLPLSPDVDPLYLTGVVEQVDDGCYRIQNLIYRGFLLQHFHPTRVGHLLSMAGRWDWAIDYLEAGIEEGNEQARMDLSSATITSMYTAEDVMQAARFLTRGLSAVFGAVEAKVWYSSPPETSLRLVGHLGPTAEGALWNSPEISMTADRLEARAYRQARALRGPEGTRYVWRAIPLLIPGQRPVGVVTLCDDLMGDRFVQQRERELELLGYLSQAARALQAVGKRRQELTLAGHMQASLLPAAPPELTGWQLAVAFRPARETAGDFYDFIPLPGGRLGIVIADVADKGMGAALYMALSRTLIRTYAADYPSRPDLALRAANQRMLADTQSGLFVTVFYGILDPGDGTLTYCNAGHPPPLLLGAAGGSSIQSLPGRGMALGVVEDLDWGYTELQVDPGATLLLFTDGILDAQNTQQERFGSDALVKTAQAYVDKPAQEVQDALLAQVQQFTGGASQFDDITLVVARRNP